MTVSKSRQIFDEICDNISTTAKASIASIDRMEKKIASLELVEAQMLQEAENATFQLVAQLPSSGKADIYYIVLNSTTNKYEEYVWSNSAFHKVGLIGDMVVPTLTLAEFFDAVSTSSVGYHDANPASSDWKVMVNEVPENTENTHTWEYVYTEVDKEGADYSSSNPSTSSWYEVDVESSSGYKASIDTEVNLEKTYYTRTEEYVTTYYVANGSYWKVMPSTEGYSEMNPKKLDWYERDGDVFSQTLDQSPVNAKTYYVPRSA